VREVLAFHRIDALAHRTSRSRTANATRQASQIRPTSKTERRKSPARCGGISHRAGDASPTEDEGGTEKEQPDEAPNAERLSWTPPPRRPACQPGGDHASGAKVRGSPAGLGCR
jgi:hypothetical protein